MHQLQYVNEDNQCQYVYDNDPRCDAGTPFWDKEAKVCTSQIMRPTKVFLPRDAYTELGVGNVDTCLAHEECDALVNGVQMVRFQDSVFSGRHTLGKTEMHLKVRA